MGEAVKYLFDRNFEAPAPDAEPPEIVIERELRSQFEQELAAARASEYERGRNDGSHEARQSLEATTDQAVAQLVQQAGSILDRLDDECRSTRSEAIQVALTAAERLAGELIQREPTALLESLFSKCLEYLGEAPHIAIRVNDALAERLQDKIQETAARQGFPGKVIVLGDPETQTGDCRIEWADGGVTRDFEKLKLNVNEIVRRHLASGDMARTPQPESETVEVDDTAAENSRAPATASDDKTTRTNSSGDQQ